MRSRHGQWSHYLQGQGGVELAGGLHDVSAWDLPAVQALVFEIVTISCVTSHVCAGGLLGSGGVSLALECFLALLSCGVCVCAARAGHEERKKQDCLGVCATSADCSGIACVCVWDWWD